MNKTLDKLYYIFFTMKTIFILIFAITISFLGTYCENTKTEICSESLGECCKPEIIENGWYICYDGIGYKFDYKIVYFTKKSSVCKNWEVFCSLTANNHTEDFYYIDTYACAEKIDEYTQKAYFNLHVQQINGQKNYVFNDTFVIVSK